MKGISYYVKGELSLAMESYESALEFHQELGFRTGQSAVLTNMANIYDDFGDAEKALD